MEKIVAAILKLLAVLTVKKYEPGIIGVTGSVGKTSAKEAIYTVLRNIRQTRASRGNFNGEVGLPLTILGDWHAREQNLFSREHQPGKNRVRKFLFLVKVVIVSFLKLIFGKKSGYPELLVMEYGADKPGDIKRLAEIVRPQIAVITAVGDIPAHVEFYAGPEQVAKEKGRLIENLPVNGFAILNGDDEQVLKMKDRTRAHVITFGFSDEAELRITNFENRTEGGKPAGVSFKLEYGGSFVPVRIEKCFGKPVAYAAAAAAACGIVFGMHLVRIAEALIYFEPPLHRMRLIPGIKTTNILDDAYNASPLSMAAAMETARSFSASRKVAVLGDMLEIGKYSIEAHEALGKLAAKIFDFLVTVGPRAKFIAEAAKTFGFPKRNILSFDTADEARLKVQDLIKKGDLILIKASWAMRFDKIVEEIRQM